jgi:hypothetical protein
MEMQTDFLAAGFEIVTAVYMNVAIFWDIVLCVHM